MPLREGSLDMVNNSLKHRLIVKWPQQNKARSGCNLPFILWLLGRVTDFERFGGGRDMAAKANSLTEQSAKIETPTGLFARSIPEISHVQVQRS
jgi:hypothetical protein